MRFEPVLERYMGQHPMEMFVKPTGLTYETFTCRLRDAVTALKRNEQWNPMLARFVQSNWSDITVSHDGTAIRIGPRQSKAVKGSYEMLGNVLKSATISSNEIRLNPSPKRFDCVCELLSLLDGEMQVRFTRTQLSNSFLTETLSNYPNVEAFEDGDDVILL